LPFGDVTELGKNRDSPGQHSTLTTGVALAVAIVPGGTLAVATVPGGTKPLE